MASVRGILRMHQDEEGLCFQLEGQGTMHHSLPLRRLAEAAITAGVPMLRVDLSRCLYMDSTFIGTLLILKRSMAQRGLGTFALKTPSSQCLRLLHQMGIEDLPVANSEELLLADWTEVNCNVDDPNYFNDNVVQAHQELAELPAPTGKSFQGVVNCLTKEMEGKKPKKKEGE